MKNRLNINQKGQTAIEYAFTMVILFGIAILLNTTFLDTKVSSNRSLMQLMFHSVGTSITRGYP